jgi:hypothetical protein
MKRMAPRGKLEEGGDSAAQDEAVDLQQGTKANGNSCSCVKGHSTQSKDFTFGNLLIDYHT